MTVLLAHGIACTVFKFITLTSDFDLVKISLRIDYARHPLTICLFIRTFCKVYAAKAMLYVYDRCLES